MITGVHHSSISVSDGDRTLAFYRDLLGLPVLVDEVRASEAQDKILGVAGSRIRVIMVKAGHDVIEFIQYIQPSGGLFDRKNWDAGSPHFAFEVSDVDAAYEALAEKGARFFNPPQTLSGGRLEGYRCAYFSDPDGVTVEIIQPPKKQL
ncbi:MAG: VOC family protein [Chloroflexi bacterium]|nr:VOC family protein [Chloroflexota bacterium]